MAKKSQNKNFDAIEQQQKIDQEWQLLVQITKEYEKLLDRKKKGKPIDDDRLNTIRKEYGSLSMIEKKINDLGVQFNSYNKTVEDFKDELNSSVNNSKELDDSLASIGNIIGKNSALYDQHLSRINNIKGVTNSISRVLQDNQKLNTEDRKKVQDVVDAYKNQEVAILGIQKEYARGNIDKEQAARMIQQEAEAFENVASKIDKSSAAGKELVDVIKLMNKESQSFALSAKKTQEEFQTLDNVMGSFGGIPPMNELNKLIKTNVNDTLALKAAFFALGAAIASAAFEYFGADFQTGRQIEFDAKIRGIETEKNLIQSSIATNQNLTKLPIEDIQVGSGTQIEGIDKLKGRNFLQEGIDIDLAEINNTFEKETLPKLQQEAKYAGAKAGIQFSDSFQQGAAQFKAAAKTARFGEQLGATGFNRGELQLAGIDPSQISDAMSQLAAQTGKVPTAKLATEMALIAKRTGQSSESVASLAEYFQRTDNLSADAAVNMVEGMRAMAAASNLDLGNLMQGVAESSKDALSYQIKSAEALTKQVAAAQSIGVNFNKLASAGKNMVLNYKDSIKAEMQLSSMLGRSVNLSEIRTKAMSGDYEGMMNALKAQGLNPEDMNMFQQEALQQALGGMDLESIQKIYKGEVKTAADLKPGDAAGAGGQFLKATKQAQASLSAEQASISANTAILSAKLENQMANEFLKAYGPGIKQAEAEIAARRARLQADLDSATESTKAYRDLTTEITKATYLFNLFGNVINGAVAALGGLLMMKLGPKFMPGLGNMFRSSTGTTAGGQTAPGGRSPISLTTKSGKTITSGGQTAPGGRSPISLTTKSGKTITSGGPKPNIRQSRAPKIRSPKIKSAKSVGGFILGLGMSLLPSAVDAMTSSPAVAPEVDNTGSDQTYLDLQQLRDEYLNGTEATDNVASEIQKSNDLLTEANKANNLSGICSCIASNMQEHMGGMIAELQRFKAANEYALEQRSQDASAMYGMTVGDVGMDAASFGATMLVDKAGSKVYEKISSKFAEKKLAQEGGETLVSKKIGQEGVEKLAGKKIAQEGGEKLAQKGAEKIAQKTITKGIQTSIASTVLKGANVAGIVGLGAELAGGYLKGQGMAEADTGKYNTGRALETTGNALSMAALGATIGSVIPGIGTAVGAVVGGGFGLLQGLFTNYFSEDAQKEAEAVKIAEEEKLKAEALNAQIDYLIKIQEPGVAAAQKTFEQTDKMAKLAADEPTWRNAMLLQTLEMTRLLSIIASDFVNTTQDGKLKDKLGNEVSIGNYDKTFKLQAERGVLNYDNAREADIAKILGQFNKNPGQKLKIGGEMMDMKGYMEKYKVSQKEIDIVTEKSQFMSMNQNVINQQKLNQSGNKVTPAGGNTNTNVGGNTNTNTNVGGNTNTNNTNTASLTSLLTVLQTTQTNDDTRGKIIYGHLKDVISAYLGRIEMRMTAPIDLMNATLLTISTDMALIRSYLETKSTTAGMSDQSSVILKQIQTQAEVRGLNAYAKEIQQNGNLQRIVDRSTKNVDETKLVKQKIQNLNEGTIPSTKNMNDIQIEMLQVLQDHTELLSAVAANTLKPDAPQIVRLDGRTISTNIATRMQQRQTFNKSKTLQYKAT